LGKWGADVDLNEWQKDNVVCECCGDQFTSYAGLNFCSGGGTVRYPLEETKCIRCRDDDDFIGENTCPG